MFYVNTFQICDKLNNGWQQSYNTDAEESIAYGEGQLVTYDNERSISAKVDYINRMGLGGAMIWALDFDDFTGQFCNRGRYPLLTAINKSFLIERNKINIRRTQSVRKLLWSLFW